MTVNIANITVECQRHSDVTCDVTVTSQLFGNKCQHNPLVPRQFIPPKNHKPRWDFLAKAIRNLNRYYYKPLHWLGELWITRYIENENHYLINNDNHSHNDNKNHYHQIRSERREATVAILQVILHYLDINSLQLKIQEGRGGVQFIPTVTWIAKKANVSLKRAYRCLSDLRNAGYINFEERWKSYQNSQFVGLAAIKTINKKLLIHLGISEKLIQARQRRKENNTQKKEEPAFLERMRINSPELYEVFVKLRFGRNRAPP